MPERQTTAKVAEKPAKTQDYPDTPSGKALAEHGEGPEAKHDNLDEVNAHAEKYQAAKRKARWGH
jgi:hypothetical protein